MISHLGLGQVDMYGDSYGTFFAQVFAGRHADLLRSIVLDGAYPTARRVRLVPDAGSGDALVVREGRAGARRPAAVTVSASRRPCAACCTHVRRHPWHGISHDGDGRRARVTVSAETLATTAFGATYGPYAYRELTAALRSALHGDRAPLLRLVAEAEGGGTDAGPVRDYSEGLDAAVACHDYPQLYDMTGVAGDASPAVPPRPGPAYGVVPAHLRPVHGPRVRPLRLAGAGLVHAVAARPQPTTRPARHTRRAGTTRACRRWC